jgi:hypothetical protein
MQRLLSLAGLLGQRRSRALINQGRRSSGAPALA